MGNLLYDVPVRFDGRYLRPANANQGEPTRVAALDADGDGRFDLRQDVVLLTKKDGSQITESDLSSVSSRYRLASLSPTGRGKLTEADLEQAGLIFAFDRNGDDRIEVNRGVLARGWAKLKNALGEGAVTFNGDEKISVAGKRQVGTDYFNDYRATLDLDRDAFKEEFVFNQRSYDEYSNRMDRARLGFGLASAAGFGWFFVAKNIVNPSPAVVITGALGFAVGGIGALAATMAKTRPDLPVRY